MNMGESESPQPIDVQRGRRNLLLLFAIALTPVLLAMAMYFGGFGVPDARTNKGSMLQPARPLPIENWAHVDMEAQWNVGPKTGWKLVYAGGPQCDQACEEMLHHARQSHIATGRLQDRIERFYLAIPAAPDAATRAKLAQQFPGYQFLVCAENVHACQIPEGTGALYLADPLGNLILRYTPEDDPRALLDDLKKLLKVSRIG